MMQRIADTEPEQLISVAVKSTAPFQKQMHLLGEEIKNWLEQKNEILICLGDKTKIAYLQDVLEQQKYLYHEKVSRKNYPKIELHLS